jgi:hypothetical protein
VSGFRNAPKTTAGPKVKFFGSRPARRHDRAVDAGFANDLASVSVCRMRCAPCLGAYFRGRIAYGEPDREQTRTEGDVLRERNVEFAQVLCKVWPWVRVFGRYRRRFRRFIAPRCRLRRADIQIGEHFRDWSPGRSMPRRRHRAKPKGEDVREPLLSEFDALVSLFGRKLVVTYVETRADSDW